MAKSSVGGAHSARARLVAMFVVIAMVLGGGGSPNPSTELLLELAFAACAVIWLWLPSERARGAADFDRLVIVLIIVVLALPIVQLLPLPPSLWTALPAREDQLASLALVGKEHSWRPISLSPSRTLAALLAIVPAVGCAYAVARLDSGGRRLVLAAIVAMAVISCMLGVLQLVAGDRGINLYSQFHAGWVTGFHANRNAEADVLLVGFLALVTLWAPYVFDSAQKFPMMFDQRAVRGMMLGLALFTLVATIMTGSRAGTALIPVAIAFALAILATTRADRQRTPGSRFVLLGALVLAGGLAVVLLAYTGHTAIGRVAQRFAATDDARLRIWPDTWFALGRYWPSGFGLGGFEPAMLPAERLEFLDASIPNRAHNDFMELGLEAGVWGYFLLAVAVLVCFAMAYKAWRQQPNSRAQILFAAGVLFVISLHSLVDYPLRSMALACLAGVAGGMLATSKAGVSQGNNSNEPLMVESLA